MNLAAIIEALLFVSEQPVSMKELAETIGVQVSDVQAALGQLKAERSSAGIRLVSEHEQYHLVSAPEYAEYAAKLLHKELRGDLTSVAVETLAIIAYRQPVTKAEIENIRGLSSDYVIRQLLIRGLIEPRGRRHTIGKPIEYGTTMELMHHLGITDPEALPELPAAAALEPAEIDQISIDSITPSDPAEE